MPACQGRSGEAWNGIGDVSSITKPSRLREAGRCQHLRIY